MLNIPPIARSQTESAADSSTSPALRHRLCEDLYACACDSSATPTSVLAALTWAVAPPGWWLKSILVVSGPGGPNPKNDRSGARSDDIWGQAAQMFKIRVLKPILVLSGLRSPTQSK